MIKKILSITIAMVLLLAPVASANDCAFYDGRGKVGVKIIPSSYHIEIGEDYTFTAEITNYTPYQLDRVSVYNFFKDSRGMWQEYDVVIGPYKTIKLEIEVFIIQDVKWYRDGSKYFSDLQPYFEFFSEEAMDIYVIRADKKTLEIDNLKNGDSYLSGEITDRNTVFMYQARKYSFFDGEFMLYGEMANQITLTNHTDKDIDIYFDSLKDYMEPFVEANGTYSVVAHFEDFRELYDLPANTKVGHNFVFEIDGQYYGITVEKYYPAKGYYQPKIKFEVVGEKNENGDVVKMYFTIYNYSDSDIRDFYINIDNKNYDLPQYIFPVIRAKDTIKMDLPLYNEQYIPGYITYGYTALDENFLIGWCTGHIEGGIEEIDDDEMQMWNDYLGDNLEKYAEDLDYIFGYITGCASYTYDIITPTPYVIPTPVPTITEPPTIEPTDTPAKSPTATTYLRPIPDDEPEYEEVPYIPFWAWIAAAAAAGASGAAIYYIVAKGKKENDEKDDE